ncbi:MAG: TMEM165/GDT1 family protein [Elusimicrobiota bacterium]
MDWKAFLATFGMIFLAELGDKTQLAAISMTSSTKKPWEVFLGATLALAVVTAIGVIFGQSLMRIVPEHAVHTGAGILFILIGVLILFGKF